MYASHAKSNPRCQGRSHVEWLRRACFLLVSQWAIAATALADEFTENIAPFLTKHCHTCHGPDKQQAQIRYDQLPGYRTTDRTLWTLVHQQITAGEMPPADQPQPAAAEKQGVLRWIEQQQRAHRPGSSRRLNRRELAAALRDVTGLNADFAYALPGDGKTAGFDTGAEALQEASDAVAQWLHVTQRAVDGVRFLEAPEEQKFFADLRGSKDPRKTLDDWKNLGASSKVQGIGRSEVGLLLEPRAVGDRDALNISVPVPSSGQAMLRLKLAVSVMKPYENIPFPRLWVEIGGKDLDYAEITAPFDQPQELEYIVPVGDLAIQPKGVTISLSNKVEVPYAVEGFENEDRVKPEEKEKYPGGSGLFRPQFDRKALPPEKQPAPHIVLQRIEVTPHDVAPWPPASWQANVGEVQDDIASAEKLIALWQERAWRRPPTAAERQPFLKLYRQVRDDGSSFDAAVRAACQSILLSAPFRYAASPADPDPTIAQHAIASRLSFFLTGEPPDAELRRLAAAGKMKDREVLAAQANRLLDDPRSRGFVQPFVTQWLELDQPITIVMTHMQKQDFRFARHLKASMREETLQFFARLIADNRPLRELIDSDWTMLNDILARHYGYEGIEGGALRPVKLKADDPRGGGLLSHAGIQSMLCWMGDNWVIYRGAWAMRHILDSPPPPPPLEVPELNPSANAGKSFKELLRQHQTDEKCSICHKHMDPLGFAFQNFDISGRWRDVEHDKYDRAELDGKIAWNGVGKSRPVDAAGKLPRGEEFASYAEFKQLMVKHYQADLTRGVLKNLVIYGTGRIPDVDDLKEIASLMKSCESKGYRSRDLIVGFVLSPAFQQ